MHQKYTFTLEASAIKQMHKAIAISQPIESDASPSSEIVLANLVVLYFESMNSSNQLLKTYLVVILDGVRDGSIDY